MPKITKYYAIHPIMNKKCHTFGGKFWWLADNIKFSILSEDDARFLEENLPNGLEDKFFNGQRAFIQTNLESGKFSNVNKKNEESIKKCAMITQFVLNFFANSESVCIPYTILIKEAKNKTIIKIYDFEIWGDSIIISKNHYKITSGFHVGDFRKLYSISFDALTQNPNLSFIISRFCSSLLKNNPQDKIIDLTIALESMIPGNTELIFKFSYYLSLLIDGDLKSKNEVFENLKKLYSARSDIVHGNNVSKKNFNYCISNWNYYVSIAKKCIFYYLIFHSVNRSEDWETHLMNLGFGENQLVY